LYLFSCLVGVQASMLILLRWLWAWTNRIRHKRLSRFLWAYCPAGENKKSRSCRFSSFSSYQTNTEWNYPSRGLQ